MGQYEMTLGDILSSRKSEQVDRWINFEDYAHHLMEGLSGMFIRSGYPDSVSGIYRMEEWMIQYGAACIVKPASDKLAFLPDKSEYRCCIAQFGGMPYADGVGSLLIARSEDGYVEEFDDWRENENCIVSFNSKLRVPDWNVGRTAKMLTEVDTSLKLLVYYARFYNVPLVNDEKLKTLVEDVLNAIDNGRIKAVVSDNMKQMLLGDGSSKGVDMMQLTDPRMSMYIQYIDHYKDDLLRWFWSYYGMNTSGSSKMAQQSVEEINIGDSLSMIIPHERYHCRLEEVEQAIKKFGWSDYKIDFAEPWQNQFSDCKKENDEDEEVNEDGEVPDDLGSGGEEGADDL